MRLFSPILCNIAQVPAPAETVLVPVRQGRSVNRQRVRLELQLTTSNFKFEIANFKFNLERHISNLNSKLQPQTLTSNFISNFNFKHPFQVLTLYFNIKLQPQTRKSNLNIKPQSQAPSLAELGPAQPQLVLYLSFISDC